MERDLGEQPIAKIMTDLGLSSSDIVSASTEQITHKMISRACKGRRLNPHVQAKICNALNNASKKTYSISDLFDY